MTGLAKRAISSLVFAIQALSPSQGSSRPTRTATGIHRYSTNWLVGIGKPYPEPVEGVVPAYLRPVVRPLAALFAATLIACAAHAEERHELRLGVLQFGTVNWELEVIRERGLARKQGIDLETIPLSSKTATRVALEKGAVQVIVDDWLWVSRQRASGRAYTFVPYSLSLGAIMVRPNSGISSLRALKGKRLGVAGGPLDKSWLILRAYVRRHLDTDVSDLVDPFFAAAPLLNRLLLRGQLMATLNYWHHNALLEAAGMRRLIGVAEMLRELGVERPVPLIGWVFDADWADAHRETITGFLRASMAAKRVLKRSDSAWQGLSERMSTLDTATLSALRDAYRAGIPGPVGEADIEAARKVFAILAREGGEELVGPSRTLSDGTFWERFDYRP